MNSIREFFQSIFESYTERIKSPFIGSFILSFVIYNWRPLCLLFFSDWPIHCRIEWIDEKYCNLSALVWPFIIALFYIMVLPYINLFFEWVLLKYNDQRFAKRNKLRIQTLTQQKEEAILKRDIADAEAGTSEINNLKSRNDALLKEIENLAEQNKNDSFRLNAIIENSKQGEENIQSELEKQIKEKEKIQENYSGLLNNDRYISLPSKVTTVIDKLTVEERRYFEQLCDYKIFGKTTGALIEESKISKLEKLNFIEKYDKEDYSFELTYLGEILYQYISQKKWRDK